MLLNKYTMFNFVFIMLFDRESHNKIIGSIIHIDQIPNTFISFKNWANKGNMSCLCPHEIMKYTPYRVLNYGGPNWKCPNKNLITFMNRSLVSTNHNDVAVLIFFLE